MSFVVTACWVARAGEEEHVAAAIEQLAARSRAEPGCVMYRAQRNLEDQRIFLLYEVYASREAYAQHLASEHFRLYATECGIPLLEARERTFYEPFAA